MNKENLFEPGKVRLFSGRYVNVAELTENDIDILDIASGLCAKPRFNGQGEDPISLALHSVFVSSMCDNKLGGLLHDAHEAYLFDIPTPFKKLAVFEPIVGLENKIQYIINKVFCIDNHYTDDVKVADKMVLRMEWELSITRDILRGSADKKVKMMCFLMYFADIASAYLREKTTEEIDVLSKYSSLKDQIIIARQYINSNTR